MITATDDQLALMRALDNISLETLNQLSSADRVVDCLRGNEINKPGIISLLLQQNAELNNELVLLRVELVSLKADLGKIISHLTDTADLYSLKSRYY